MARVLFESLLVAFPVLAGNFFFYPFYAWHWFLSCAIYYGYNHFMCAGPLYAGIFQRNAWVVSHIPTFKLGNIVHLSSQLEEHSHRPLYRHTQFISYQANTHLQPTLSSFTMHSHLPPNSSLLQASTAHFHFHLILSFNLVLWHFPINFMPAKLLLCQHQA